MSTETRDRPRTLGRYELVHLLGQGGMGEVWLAKISGVAGFEKPCIVKTILPALLRERQFLDRFHHEAKVLVHLVHSSIAQVYDMGEAEGTCYIALEYVAGVDLAYVAEQARARGLGVPVPVALYIGQRMAEGLGYAHRKVGPDGAPLGIVHRDVSPHNVMVSYEGEVKVIDFGLAKSAARSHYTLPSTVMGKLGYMSPEQARAEPVDARGDLYACGVVVWELLAGRPLVAQGTMGEMMAAMVHPSVPALSALRPEVSPELDAVVRRALAPAPHERYARADDFARALAEQLLRSGASLGGEEVGAWVRQVCPEAFAAQRQLLSKISSPGSRRPFATPLPESAEPFAATLPPAGVARFSPPPERPGAASLSGYAATALRPASDVSGGAPPAPVSGGVPAGVTGAVPAAPVSRRRPVGTVLAAVGLVGLTAGLTHFLGRGPPPHHEREAFSSLRPSPEQEQPPPHGPPPHGHPRPPRPPPPPPGHPRPPPPAEAQEPGAAPEHPPRPDARPSIEEPASVLFAKRAAEHVSAKAVVALFQEGSEHFVRGGSHQGLEMGSVLTVVGPLEEGGQRRRLGEAVVVAVWPSLARVSLDDGLRVDSGRHFVVLPDAPVKPPSPGGASVGQAPAAPTGQPLVGHASLSGMGRQRKVTLYNTDTRTWSGCKGVVRGGRAHDFGSLAPGDQRGALLRDFDVDARAPVFHAARVRLLCEEGEGDFPLRK